ncbi:hypothetical protein [Sphingomonas sp. Leaf20]|uniref:hypothetical protein n=1 Tax=Sphingomonas sp. Leaf20 TaxID=1735685 RepID=UPI0012E2E3B3|nr:hypothetical protein [Sphingomonas sp. Leaf20]
MEQRSVKIDAVLSRRSDGVFGDEQQIVCSAPAFQQILERLAQYAFAATARDSAQPIEICAVFIDQLSARAPS